MCGARIKTADAWFVIVQALYVQSPWVMGTDYMWAPSIDMTMYHAGIASR